MKDQIVRTFNESKIISTIKDPEIRGYISALQEVIGVQKLTITIKDPEIRGYISALQEVIGVQKLTIVDAQKKIAELEAELEAYKDWKDWKWGKCTT